ncbi:MAG: hypothetical protein LBQ96_02630 [Fusobacteriaceae bacterium]|jgi:hypothetical protein|nr:hypothetical protein [Fusobacteriaceae bacterium]
MILNISRTLEELGNAAALFPVPYATILFQIYLLKKAKICPVFVENAAIHKNIDF